MPRRCSVCDDPRREDIEKALEGGSARAVIASQFGIPKNRIDHHAAKHGRIVAVPVETMSDVARKKAEVQAIIDKAKKKGEDRLVVLATREWRALDEHEQRLEQAQVDGASLVAHPAWPLMLRKLLECLQECERCTASVTRATGGIPAPK